jgi:hypothetical protein
MWALKISYIVYLETSWIRREHVAKVKGIVTTLPDVLFGCLCERTSSCSYIKGERSGRENPRIALIENNGVCSVFPPVC